MALTCWCEGDGCFCPDPPDGYEEYQTMTLTDQDAALRAHSERFTPMLTSHLARPVLSSLANVWPGGLRPDRLVFWVRESYSRPIAPDLYEAVLRDLIGIGAIRNNPLDGCWYLDNV